MQDLYGFDNSPGVRCFATGRTSISIERNEIMTDTQYKLIWSIVGAVLICLLAIAGRAQEQRPMLISGGFVCSTVDEVHLLAEATEKQSREDIPDHCFILVKPHPAFIEPEGVHETDTHSYAIAKYTFLPPLRVNLVDAGNIKKVYEVGYGWWDRPQPKNAEPKPSGFVLPEPQGDAI